MTELRAGRRRRPRRAVRTRAVSAGLAVAGTISLVAAMAAAEPDAGRTAPPLAAVGNPSSTTSASGGRHGPDSGASAAGNSTTGPSPVPSRTVVPLVRSHGSR